MKVFKPSDNPITQDYSSSHKGYDFAGLNLPNEVRSGLDGEIIERVDLYTTNWSATSALTTKDYGNYIKVKHDNGTFALFAHLRKGSSFEIGTKVKKGQTIARIGNTGNSTGNHLHSEYRNASNINIEAEFETEPMAVLTQKELDIIRNRRDELYNLLQTETAKNNKLSKQLQDEQEKSQGLSEAFDKQSEADADTGAQLLDAQHERDNFLNRLESIASALNSPSIELKDLLGQIDNLRKPADEVADKITPVLNEFFSNLQKGKIKSIWEWLKLGFNILRNK